MLDLFSFKWEETVVESGGNKIPDEVNQENGIGITEALCSRIDIFHAQGHGYIL